MQNNYLFTSRRPSWTFSAAKSSLEKWITPVRVDQQKQRNTIAAHTKL